MPAETLHSTPQGSTPEERRLAKAQAELEKAAFDLKQKTEFGLLDQTAPNEGEDTYQSYLDKRPSEGIYRSGDNFHDAQTGSFASESSYKSQKGDTQAYYDQLGGIENKGEYEVPNYEEMGVMQLAKEAAKARQLGDKAEEATIREALDTHLTINALKDNKETPEEAQARYEKDVERYDALVQKFSAPAEANAATANAPETPQVQVVGDAAESKGEASSEATEELLSVGSSEEEPKFEMKSGGRYNGKRISVIDVKEISESEGAGGGLALKVVDEDGDVHFIHENEITYGGAQDEKRDADEAETVSKEVEVATNTSEVEVVESDDIDALNEIIDEQNSEPRQTSKSSKDLERYEHEEEKEETPKKWWQKVGEGIRKRAGVAYWAAWGAIDRSTASIRDFGNQMLEIGVEDTMTEQEKEKRRTDNRYAVMIAGAAAAVLLGTHIVQDIVEAANASGTGAPDLTGGKYAGGRHIADMDGAPMDMGSSEGVVNLPLEGDVSGPELVDSANASFTVGSGEGGEALFQRLGIDSSEWYNNASSLVDKFPQDFYREGSDVRLMHSGPLSQGAQDFINSLR